MKVLMYLLYGDKAVYWDELKFSLLTALNFLKREPNHNITIVVYTDQPDMIRGYPVTIVPFDREQLEVWAGPLKYYHRSKNRAMAAIMDKFKCPTVFVDTDTYFMKSPSQIFDRIAPGKAVMHEREGVIMSDFPEWAAHLKDFTLRDGVGRSHAFANDTEMWNSGIVGLDYTDRDKLDQTLWLVDQLYAKTRIFNAEQYALGEILRLETELVPSDDVVFHYWGMTRAFFQKEIERFFTKHRGATLEARIDDAVNYEAKFPKRPIVQKAKYHLKGLLFNWTSIYLSACMAIACGMPPGKPGTEDGDNRIIWRDNAWHWLNEEFGHKQDAYKAQFLSATDFQKLLRKWLKTSDLAPLREPAYLALLDPEERRRWETFWTRVNESLDKIEA